jgi:hypothetical protein
MAKSDGLLRHYWGKTLPVIMMLFRNTLFVLHVVVPPSAGNELTFESSFKLGEGLEIVKIHPKNQSPY